MVEPTNIIGTDLDGTNLKTLVSIFWRGKWVIFWTTLAFSLVAAVAAEVLPKSYVASTVVAPESSANGSALSGLSSLTSQLGGLASLAGITVSGDSKKFESIAVLQSEGLTEKYISGANLLPILFASKWDPQLKKWKSSNPKKIPTLWQANQYFKKIRTVSTDAKTGLITLAITWKDPASAAVWANDLVRLTNEYMREKAIREAEAGIAYLNEQAIKTDVVAVKQGIYAMIQGEINKIMVAKGSEEFALKVIDQAFAPEKQYSPQPISWTVEGFVTGFLLSLFVVFNTKKKYMAT
jgi:uncharacterized protein involved in exopolysaccharide biosynthesis